MDIQNHLNDIDIISKKNGVKQTMYGFILENGMGFKPFELPKQYDHMKGKSKECFFNAYTMAVKTGYYYVEGYAMGIIPVLHAWVTDSTCSLALDPTWSDGKEYFGVVLPMTYVERIIFQRKAYGVIDCYEIDFPLITGEHTYNKKNKTVNSNGKEHHM